MKRAFSNVMAYLFGLCLCLCLVCVVVENVSFDVDYHLDNLDYPEIKTDLPVSDDQIKQVATDIVSYIKGDKESMQVELPGGRGLFNDRELLHMADVRHLFSFCSFLKIILIGFAMVLGIGVFFLNGVYAIRILGRGVTMVMLWLMLALGVLGAWYMLDFNSFWTAFHKVAFTNDLWLMMPDDAIIIFYSSKFFTAVVQRIIQRMALAFGITMGAGIIGWICGPRKRGRSFGKKNSSD